MTKKIIILPGSQVARLARGSAEADKAHGFLFFMPFVYLLLSEKDNRTYLGSTTDLDIRLKEHKQGKCRSTKNRRPLILIYFEKFEILSEARKREQYLKTRAGRKELKTIFEKINPAR